jgi:hypothetical protein
MSIPGFTPGYALFRKEFRFKCYQLPSQSDPMIICQDMSAGCPLLFNGGSLPLNVMIGVNTKMDRRSGRIAAANAGATILSSFPE